MWQPIETAPKAKQGAPVLVVDLWMTDGKDYGYRETGCFWFRGKWRQGTDEGPWPVENPGIVWASHWMPLPEPPSP